MSLKLQRVGEENTAAADGLFTVSSFSIESCVIENVSINLMTGSDGYDSTYPPLFFCLSVDVMVCFSFPTCFLLFPHPANQCRQFGHIPQMRGLFVNRLLGIRVIAWTPHSHFKILFNSIRRAASASWSGLIWQQGISLYGHWAFSTCICLSMVLISKAFVS